MMHAGLADLAIHSLHATDTHGRRTMTLADDQLRQGWVQDVEEAEIVREATPQDEEHVHPASEAAQHNPKACHNRLNFSYLCYDATSACALAGMTWPAV